MTFFNKKTDVVKIELTQYGKFLLAKGKFKPVYYQFFDGDVLYDGNYADIDEERNDIQERIKNETPYLKPQYNFSGVETKLKKLKELKKNLQERTEFLSLKKSDILQLQGAEEKLNIASYPLGTSKINIEYPTISMFCGDVEISGTSRYGEYNGKIIHIPQIIMKEPKYDVTPVKQSDVDIAENINLTTELFPDQNSYLEIKEQVLLFKFDESNVTDIYKNFEIELYEITSSKGEQVYLPLYFTEQADSNDINSVEYYFDIRTDSQISTTNIDKIKTPTEQPNVFPRLK